ncbi:MAG: hypothetical protein ACREAA_04625 [Candidatus Polarisedimenticolia bacterium]
MTDIADLLRRQAAWQKSLRNLPWHEKVRMIAKLRSHIRELQRLEPSGSTGKGRGRQV